MGSNIRIGKDPNTGFWYLSAADAATLGISAYIQTLLNDADAAAAQETLGLTSFLSGVVDAPRAVGANCTNNTTTPNTQYDLNADWLVLVAPGSFLPVVRKEPGVITCNVSTAGPAANGRDQGAAFSSSSWIHFYWIWNGATLATIASAAAPPTGPSLPSGYTHWTYAGAVRFNASSQLFRTRIRGNRVTYDSLQTAGSSLNSASEANVSLANLIPPNALTALLQTDLTGTSDGSGAISMQMDLRVLTGNNIYSHILGTLSGLAVTSAMRVGGRQFVEIPNVGQNVIYATSVSLGSAQSGSIFVEGYTVPNG